MPRPLSDCLASVTEAFFESLHDLYAEEADVRRNAMPKARERRTARPLPKTRLYGLIEQSREP